MKVLQSYRLSTPGPWFVAQIQLYENTQPTWCAVTDDGKCDICNSAAEAHFTALAKNSERVVDLMQLLKMA